MTPTPLLWKYGSSGSSVRSFSVLWQYESTTSTSPSGALQEFGLLSCIAALCPNLASPSLASAWRSVALPPHIALQLTWLGLLNIRKVYLSRHMHAREWLTVWQ